MNEKLFVFILIFLLICIIILMIAFKSTTDIIFVLIVLTSIITIGYFGHEIITKEHINPITKLRKDKYYNKKPLLRDIIQERNADEYIPDNILFPVSYTNQTGYNNPDDELEYSTYNNTAESFYESPVKLYSDKKTPTERLRQQFEQYYINDDSTSINNNNSLNTDGNIKYVADIDFDNNYLKYYNEGMKQTTENMTNSTYSPIGYTGGSSNALDINDIIAYQQRERNRMITDVEYQGFFGKRGEYLSRFYGPELDAYENIEWWGNYSR